MTSSLRRFFRLLPLALALPVAAAAQVNLTVNAAQAIRTVDERVFGVNAVIWDAQANSAQTISMVQNAGIRAIRVPGGSLSDEYHWRVNKSLANSWTWATAFNGFINLITSANAQPMVTVNYGSGTPEEAAGLVAYLNASVGSSTVIAGTDGTGFAMQDSGYWAALRAAGPLGSDDGMNFLRISRSSPVGAKYFEIGNECYGTWETDQQTVAHDPTTYANRVQQYITKMKAVDPSIKIGVVLVTTSENASYKNWTPTMLARLKVLNAIPDFVIYHLYPQAPGAESDATLLQVADTGSKSWPAIATDLRQQLAANLGATLGAGVEIVVTENNSVYSSPGKQSTSLVNGLYLADSIGNLMQTEINGYMYWALRNGPPTINNGTALDGNMSASLYGWRQFGDYGMLSSPSTLTGETTYYNPYPTYYMMKLLSHFARGGDTVVQATSNNPLLSVFAVKRVNGSLSLLVINKDRNATQSSVITLNGFMPAATATGYSYGLPQDEAARLNSGSPDLAVSTLSISGPSFSQSFGAYSATVISLQAPPKIGGSSDFNGDGKSDLLWQNTDTGERSIWLMNGTTLTAGVSLGLSPTQWSIAAVADFNGDGKPDLLWQNTLTGERAFWLMNGSTFVSSADLGTYLTDLMIAGAGDFNGDGKPDLVWQNTSTGERSIWLMNGTTVSSVIDLGTFPPEWSIAGTGEFNGDGKCDLLWQNTVTGERAIWLMNGTTVTAGVALGVYPQLQISGTGDYNGDGKSDILWTNVSTGERIIWLMNGTTKASEVSLGVVSLDWVLNRPVFRRALADFNNDGKSDLVWQNTSTGDRAIWIMNGIEARTGLSLGNYAVDQWIAAVGDFNNDGKADLVWENRTTGVRSIALMNGTTVLSTVVLGTYDTGWKINTTGDFNADGKPDLVWTNTTTGARAIWLMDGTSFISGVDLGTVVVAEQVAGTGDFNADGQTDILWQNTTTGARTIWLMNGTIHTSTVTLGTYAPEWSIVGTGDYNADGKPDLLWQNTVTGERAIWLMNGTTFLSSVAVGTYDNSWAIRN